MRVALSGVCIAVLAGTLLPRPAIGQSLGEVAAREKERRKGKPDHVITEDDLHKGRSRAADDGDTSAAADTSAKPEATAKGDAATGKKEKSEEEVRAEKQKAWQDRRSKADDDVQRLTKEIDDLQRTAGNRRTYQFDPNRAQALDRLELAKKELQAAQQRLEDLEDERRREGF
jgi:hypothetical protein